MINVILILCFIFPPILTLQDDLFLLENRLIIYHGTYEADFSTDYVPLILSSLDMQKSREVANARINVSHGVFPPNWSLSGDAIVYEKQNVNTELSDIYVYNLTSHMEEKITDSTTDYLCPSWDPNGHIVYYSSINQQGHFIAHQLNMDTHVQTDIISPFEIECITISPTGTEFAFTTPRPNSKLYVSNLDFTGIQEIDSGRILSQPIWSPDGKSILYVHREAYDNNRSSASIKVWGYEITTIIEVEANFYDEFSSYGWLDSESIFYLKQNEPDQDISTKWIATQNIKTRKKGRINFSKDVSPTLFSISPSLSSDTLQMVSVLFSSPPTIRTAIPTATPSQYVDDGYECFESLTSRISLYEGSSYHKRGRVLIPLPIRSHPHGITLTTLNVGEEFLIVTGGTCGDDGLLWWRVQTLDGSIIGWSAESFGDRYLMEPVASPQD